MTRYIFFVIAFAVISLHTNTLKAQESDPFCSTLKTIMEASKDTFATIRAGLVRTEDGLLAEEKRYTSKKSFNNAKETYIIRDMKNRHISLMVVDSFHSSELVNEYYNLAERLNNCLGKGYKYEEIKDELNGVLMYKVQRHTRGPADMYEPTVYVKLNSSEDNHSLVLEVEEPFFSKKKK